MNYDNSQQFGFSFGLANATPANQQPTAQNVSGNMYPCAFQGAGDLQQQLSAKVYPVSARPAMATVAGKNILYESHQLQQQQFQNQQQLQHQQQQMHQHASAFNMVQGTLIGRPEVVPVAGLSVAQDAVCPSQAVAYGNPITTSMGQTLPISVAGQTTGYKNFVGWMTVPQAINTQDNINPVTVTSTNSQSTLPSFVHLWSHFQQQQQKHQPAVTTFIQPSHQHQQPQLGIASVQNLQVFHNPAGLQVSPSALRVSPGGLQMSPGNLQVSPRGLQVSPGSHQMSPGAMQVSPGGQTFQVPHSVQGTLSPNPLATAGLGFSALRQIQVPGSIGQPGAAIRSQMVMAPQGQVIMAQTVPREAAALSFSDMGSVEPMAAVSESVQLPTDSFAMAASSQATARVNTVQTMLSMSKSGSTPTESEVSKESSVAPTSSQVLVTTTTVTVTMSACSLNTTTATAVHVTVPVTTTLSIASTVSSSSCEHITPSSPFNTLGAESCVKDELHRGSISPSTPSTAASVSTQDSFSGEFAKQELGTVKVPYSWRRVVENGTVHYYSPSNVRLSSYVDIRTYLSQSNTCKCGLECPLIVERTFSFDPEVESRPWSMEDVTCSQDLTKLCNHKRKVLALAAFQNSATVQDSQRKSDGPAAKCRKRDKGKHGDDLLMLPLVLDSKLKTSITNAVNKQAAAAAQHLSNSGTAVQSASSGESVVRSSKEHSIGQKQSTDSGDKSHLSSSTDSVSTAGQMGSVTSDVTSDPSPVHRPPSSHAACSTPGSLCSTPGGSVGTGGDAVEGQAQLPKTHQLPGKIGQVGPVQGMRMGLVGFNNHMDPRAIPQASVQCNAFPQDSMKQPFFMQQPQQQPRPTHLHPTNQFSNCGMPTVVSSHQGPHYAHQTFRTVSPLGAQSQFLMGFPQGQHMRPQHVYPQQHYPMVYQMNMASHPQQPQPHTMQPIHHHQQPVHPMMQGVRMGSQPMWPPQQPPAHHTGSVPGYHVDPHQVQGTSPFTSMYPHAGDMWLDTGRPKSKRPRSKKDKQKLNSIVDRTSPCDGILKHKVNSPGAMMSSKNALPFTTTVATTTTATSATNCSVSFLENPAIFVAQQAAIINSSLANCQLDPHSPTHPPTSAHCPKHLASTVTAMHPPPPVVKVEQDQDAMLDTNMACEESESVGCKKEPGSGMLPVEADKNGLGTSAVLLNSCSSVSVSNQLLEPKAEPDRAGQDQLWASPAGGSVGSLDIDCSCGTEGDKPAMMQPKKKVSPKSRSRTRSVTAASKAASMASACPPDCTQPAGLQHQLHTAMDVKSVTCLAPDREPQAAPCQVPDMSHISRQVPDMSHVLVTPGGNTTWNILSMQQALAQYACNNNNTTTGLVVSTGNSCPTSDFPASNLLTAAARAQLSQQASLNSLLFPAFLSAGNVAGQDLSGMIQQQQQPVLSQPSSMAHSQPAVDTGVKVSNAVMAGLAGVSPSGVTALNQGGSVPFQLIQGPSMAPAGVLPSGSFTPGGLLAQGLPAVQGLPLSVVLPVNQQVVGFGADTVQNFPVDVVGSVVTSVSLGNAVSKNIHISKAATSLVDSVAVVSPSTNVQTCSSLSSVPAAFPQQGCETVKGTGSTVHHLPQNSPGSIGQTIIHAGGQQSLVQTGAQNTVVSAVQNVQNTEQVTVQCSGDSANAGVRQNVSVNVSIGLGAGETVMLNSLLPSILAFSTPMPPISLPMVTSVTNSLTQVIPAVGTAPTLATQQQQQAAAQFLNALGIPAMAAAALNPLLITHPGTLNTAAVSPSAQFSTKASEGGVDAKGVLMDNTSEGKQMENEPNAVLPRCQAAPGPEGVQQKMSDPTDGQDGVRMVEVQQNGQPQIIPMGITDHSQQLIVLPGSGLPLMQFLNSGQHGLGMVDKLCSATQVLLPMAPPAPTFPDLSQLGTMAALTPLGIQQMWNSLNSLQLQQLQTLQLQQLVWQQLQGMQALPHHLPTVDSTGVAASQFPLTLFGVQHQPHEAQPVQPISQQVQATSCATTVVQQQREADMPAACMDRDNENSPPVSATESAQAVMRTNSSNIDGESLDGSASQEKDVNPFTSTESATQFGGGLCGAERVKKPKDKHEEMASSIPQWPSSSTRKSIRSAHSLASEDTSPYHSVQSVGKKTSRVEAQGVTVSSAGCGWEETEQQRSACVNGDCLQTEGTASRSRGVKRSLEDRCSSTGSSKEIAV